MGCCQSRSYPYTKEYFRANLASGDGNLKNVVKYFKKNRDSVLVHTLFETAVENRRTEVVDFFLHNGIVLGRYADYSARYLTKKGHANREKMLGVHLLTEEECSKMDESLFPDVDVASHDDVMLKKLILFANFNCHTKKDYIFRMACQRQDLDFIYFLHSQGKLPKEKEIFENIFYLMCTTNSAEVIRVFFILKSKDYFNVDRGLELAVQYRKESVARLLLRYKARFGNLRRFQPGEKAFIHFLQKSRQVDAANIIRNWWIPICYDMKRPCGQRMFEKNFEAYEKSFYI
jgi:hypothetical protein